MFGRRSRHTTTKTTKPTMKTRLRGRNAKNKTYKTEVTRHDAHHHPHTTTRTAPAPVHHQHHRRRKPSMGDKVSGAMLKMKGSLTRRPGEKAAGTRRMRGTDGRGSHRVY